MRNLLLSAVLIAVPALGFTLVETRLMPSAAAVAATPAASPLGDMSAYISIVNDVRTIAAGGDLVAAEKRARDLESLWDQNADALRALDANAWGAIDGANDGLFSSLRAGKPDQAKVLAAVAVLQQALAGSAPAGQGGGVQQVAGIDVTDANGHPLPCEAMAGQVKDALTAAASPDPKAQDLLFKALERCNADDDVHADAFSAQALSLLKG